MDPQTEPLLRLIVLVGLPRAGKSTIARALAFPIVNPDAIRLAMHGQRYQALAEPFVWAVAHTMVRALMLTGHQTVIVDATNTTRKRRDDWRYPGMRVEFLHIDTPAADCRIRAVAAADTYILPVIDRMDKEFEPLAEDEPRYDPSRDCRVETGQPVNRAQPPAPPAHRGGDPRRTPPDGRRAGGVRKRARR